MQLSLDQFDFFMDSTSGYLLAESRLPAEQCRPLASLAADLVHRIDGSGHNCIGIAGAPGCGKSTLARALAHGLNAVGHATVVLSLDDYYQPLKRREMLAATHHPLFRQRGVPGTHELDRLMEDLDRLREGRAHGKAIPVFDKTTDDRAPRRRWRRLQGEVELTLLEGWCVGVPPQDRENWKQAIEASNGIDDEGGSWRRRVHYAWTDYHLALARRLDELWYIRVPDWTHVVEWRWRQECELASNILGSPDEVREFLALFEPMVEYMQQTHKQWADLSLETDRGHNISLNEKSENTP